MASTFKSYHIGERSFVSYIKREIHQGNVKQHFTEKQVAAIDIIVAEMTSNLIKYAGSGDLLYRTYTIGDEDSVFEIFCLDKGQGMADTFKMRKDGFSSSGTLGQGLGAIERLSTFTQLYSIPGWGTVLYASVSTEVAKKAVPVQNLELSLRALLVDKPKETVCGDGYFVKDTRDYYKILFGDGLGHGPFAKEAVDMAGECFLASVENDPVAMIRVLHDRVRKSRGLVGTIAILDKNQGQWKMCGVGNIATRIYGGIQYKTYMPYNGTIGLNIPNSMNSSLFPIEKHQHLIMCSDGINTRWDLNKYPAIFRYDPAMLAACIYKDHVRGTDDASVLIAKIS